MDTRQIALLIAAVTALVNILLGYSGVTSTVTCTVSSLVEQVYAAALDPSE